MRKMILILIALFIAMSLFADGTDTPFDAPQIEVLPFTDTGDVSNDTNYNNLRGNDEWWMISTTQELTNLTINSVYNGWDGYLYVYSPDSTLVASNDDGPAGTSESRVIINMSAGDTVYICIDEYRDTTNGTTYTLNVSADQTGNIIDENAPSQVTNVNPTIGEIQVALMPTLSWDFGTNTETYDVYLDVVNPPVNQVVFNEIAGVSASYTPSEDLLVNTTYFWRVVCRNSISTEVSINDMNFVTNLGEDIVLIGNGSEVNQALPIDPYFGYSYSQSIYLQSEINVEGRRIETVSYHYNQNSDLPNNNEWVIYMAHTSETSYEANTSWLPITQFTEVYSGPLPTIQDDGWIEFTLNTPFIYNNVDNLVIAVEENEPEFATSNDEFYVTAVSEDRSIYVRSDSNNPDPATPASGTLRSYIPNTKLGFGDITGGPEITYTPHNYDFGIVYLGERSDTLTVTLQSIGGSPITIQSVVDDDNTNFSLFDENSYPLVLGLAERTTLDVVFNPHEEGDLNSTIIITDSQSNTYQIELTGNGYDNVIASFPYTQSFDEDTLPITWTIDPVVSGDSWEHYQTELNDHGADFDATGNGGYYMGVDDSTPETVPAHLYTPPVNLNGLVNPIFAFKYWIGDTDNESELCIDVITSDDQIHSFAVITDSDGASDWTYLELPLMGYLNQTVSFDFRAMESTSFYGDICIDDLAIYDNSVPPAATTCLAPLDEATGVLFSGSLTWALSQGATGYYVSFGTDNPPTNIYSNQDVGSSLSIDYSGLDSNVTYYWQVIPYNVIGDATDCPVWSFTTFGEVPNPALIDEPTDGITGVSVTPTLSWTDGGNYPEGYKLSLGTDNPPTDILNAEDLGNITTYDVTTALIYETTYYWQVVPYNFVGDATDCPVWSFTVVSNPNFGGNGTLFDGYYYANSTDLGAGLGAQPVFQWVDISENSQTVTYSSADDGNTTVDLGFTFNYFGVDYDQVNLVTNGYVNFGATTSTTGGSMSIPDSGNPNNVIAMMAMDLHTTAVPSNCYYGNDEMGNFVYTVEMWNDYNDESEYIDAQLILYPTGKIKIQYRNYVNPNGDTGSDSILGDAVIGIENADGTVGIQYRKDGVGGEFEENMAVVFARSVSDLSDGGSGLYLPGNIEFDVVSVDENSDLFELNMRNFTTEDLIVANAPTLSGDDVDQYTLTDENTYPLTIPSTGVAAISIQFNPTSVGHKNVVLTIEDNATEEERNIYEIPIHGYGFVADNNDTSNHATEFSLFSDDVEGLEAIIHPDTDVDWYVFWQTAPAQIEMHTQNIFNSDVDLAAFLYGPYDDLGANIDETSSIIFSDNDYTDGVNPQFTYDIPSEASGFYYLRVARADNSPATERTANVRDGRGDYALWLSTDNHVGPGVLLPPTELSHSITYQGIELIWLAPVLDSRALVGYNIYRDDVVVNAETVSGTFYLDTDVVVGTTYEYKVTALYNAPTGESVPCDSIVVTHIQVDAPIIAEGFEEYEDFTTDMGLWVNLDNDGEDTFGFNNGIDFPGENDPMAYIVFNPASSTPPIQGANAFTGDKYAACFAADSNANDDWLITPQIQLSEEDANLQFMARSYTTQFGSELVEVAVSNGSTDPDDFTVISGDEPIQLPSEWTLYSYQLDDYVGDIIRVAIHTVSEQTFFAMFDDIMVVNNGATVDANDQVVIPEVTALRGNYPNPFNPETNISFDVKSNSDVAIDIYNIKGQKVTRLIEKNFNAGRHTVVWKGQDDAGKNVASGVYFYKMTSGDYTQTKKMMLMK